MGLDARDARALATLVEDLRRLHGDALRAVLLVGEAAGPEYRPRVTPLSVVVVLAEISAETLRRTRPRVAAWRRLRIPAPAPAGRGDASTARSTSSRSSCSSCGIDTRSCTDAPRRSSDIEVALPYLRLELEEQLRGKLLHLMSAYLEAGTSPRALRRLLLDSPPGFGVLLRGLLRLRGGESAPRPGRSAGADRRGREPTRRRAAVAAPPRPGAPRARSRSRAQSSSRSSTATSPTSAGSGSWWTRREAAAHRSALAFAALALAAAASAQPLAPIPPLTGPVVDLRAACSRRRSPPSSTRWRASSRARPARRWRC